MCRVDFPVSFKPGTNKDNSIFMPRVHNASAALLFNMVISNDEGKVVYETYCQMNGWDGTHRGIPCPGGEYQYNATILEMDKDPSQQFQRSGRVRLER